MAKIRVRLNAKTLAAFRELGRIGGKKGGPIGGPIGGKARWRGVSKAKRRALAKKAARARWSKKRNRTKGGTV